MTEESQEIQEVIPEPPKRMRGPGKKETKLTHQDNYFNEYYKKNRAVNVVCPNCGRITTKGKLHRHLQTVYCARHSKDLGEIEQIQNDFALLQADVFSNLCLLAPG